MRALIHCLRSEVRRARGSFVIACLIATIAGGAALTAAAGARRSDSAYPRFLAWSKASDFGTGGNGGGETEDENNHLLAIDLKAIAAAPFVEASAHIPIVSVSVLGPGGRPLPAFQVAAVVDADRVLAHGPIAREKVLRGRHANPDAPDEATISFSTSERLGVDVGDSITLVEDDSGRHIVVRVVGVVARQNEFPTLSGGGHAGVALTAAFKAAHPKLLSPGNDGLLVRVRPDVTRDEVERWLRANLHGTDISETGPLDRATIRTIRVETIALWFVAGVLALMFAVLLGQALFRNTAMQADELFVLRALGVTRAQLLGLGALRGILVGVIGALGACALAVIASPLTPVGLARLADPAPGIRIDATALLFGALLVLVLSVLLGVLAAWRVSSQRHVHLSRRSALPLPDGSPPVVAGLHLLIRPARRDVSSPAVTYASLCAVVACATAALVFLSSLAHLRSTPPLAGATWDGAVQLRSSHGENPSAREIASGVAGIRSEPTVAAATTGGWVSEATVNGADVPIQIFGDDSAIKPAIAEGRAPRGDREIAAGTDVMRRLHVGIGDDVTVAMPDGRKRHVEIVGRSVLVAPIFIDFGQGDAVATTAATMRPVGVPSNLALIRFRPGVNIDVALQELQQKYGVFSFSSRDRTIRGGIERLDTVPIALLLVLGALALASLVHLQIVSGRRRRVDIAILRTIGFTRRQTRTMISTYAIA
ncbi:MAG TPA: FtsX-like permease family protein, partial [Acidimicrobiia bacterium]|nr:FtsX-like permease family protein [Acidimicrobiia bacterium]